MFAWCYAGGDLDDLAFLPSFRRDDPKFSVGWRHDSLIRSVTEPCPFCSISARTHSKFITYLTRISYIMNSPLFRELKAFIAEGLGPFLRPLVQWPMLHHLAALVFIWSSLNSFLVWYIFLFLHLGGWTHRIFDKNPVEYNILLVTFVTVLVF
jgi:hypothetical protein